MFTYERANIWFNKESEKITKLISSDFGGICSNSKNWIAIRNNRKGHSHLRIITESDWHRVQTFKIGSYYNLFLILLLFYYFIFFYFFEFNYLFLFNFSFHTIYLVRSLKLRIYCKWSTAPKKRNEMKLHSANNRFKIWE